MDREGAAVLAITRNGTQLAAMLANALGGVAVVPSRFASHLAPTVSRLATYDDSVIAELSRRWLRHSVFLLVMPAGIAMRGLARLIDTKATDPAVICLDEQGRFIIPLLGGHVAGANDVAQRVAALTGGQAAITTASDVQGKPALDLLGKELGWRMEVGSALTYVSGCLVNGDLIGLHIDRHLVTPTKAIAARLMALDQVVPVETIGSLSSDAYRAGIIITHRVLQESDNTLLSKCVLYRLPVLVIGIGCRRGVPAPELRSALVTTLAEAGLAIECTMALATVDLKSSEPALLELARELNVPLQIVARESLANIDASKYSPSAARDKFGIAGVAEPCAALVARGPLIVRKRRFARCTIAVAICDDIALPAPSAGRASRTSVSEQ